MFYSVFVLGKRGPLAKVWLAAHCRKKLKKNDILSVNVSQTVEAILQSRVRMSLRLMSHLMVGVTVIHNRQTGHLLTDLEHARIVSTLRFTSGVEAPEGKLQARLTDINLPETELYMFDGFTEDHERYLPVILRPDQVSIQEPEPDFCDIGESISERDFFSVRLGEGPSFLSPQDDIIFEDSIFQDDGFGARPNRPPEELFNLFSQDAQSQPMDELPEVNINEESIDNNFQNEQPELQEEDHCDRLRPPSNIGISTASSLETARQRSSRQSRVLGEDDLVLEPIEPESIRQRPRKKVKRFITDEQTCIPRGEFNKRLRNAKDTINPIEVIILDPKQAVLQHMSLAKNLLSRPSKKVASRELKQLFTNRFAIKSSEDWILENEPYESQMENTFHEMEQEVVQEAEHDPEQEVQPPSEMEGPREAEDNSRERSQTPRKETVEESQQKKTRKRKKERETSPLAVKEKSRRQRSQDTSRSRLSQETFRRRSDYSDVGLGFDLDRDFESNRDFSLSVQSFTSQERESFIEDISTSSEVVLHFSDLMKNCRRREVAVKFYTLLVLHMRGIVKLVQSSFYGEIFIHKRQAIE